MCVRTQTATILSSKGPIRISTSVLTAARNVWCVSYSPSPYSRSQPHTDTKSSNRIVHKPPVPTPSFKLTTATYMSAGAKVKDLTYAKNAANGSLNGEI